ncbi:DEAD/DEAH box helicase [Leuconostoc palmae]|uniref:DEAD/DEAH box helicase n=1 Tax=Leuconostoc palmae TaxID=501487 RepID=UPI001C7D9D01|nr:DEAD/DEAH box helicase family protein [Leuconostoc palmae]
MDRYYGRQIVVPKIDAITAGLKIRPCFINDVCQRCGQINHYILPNQQFYCKACFILGRVSSLDVMLSLPEPNHFSNQVELTWKGQLTKQQNRVSNALLKTFSKNGEHLVWAVTGAGKTEMMFPLIYMALKQSKRVAIVSPRVDVIVELAPRIQEAFMNTDLAVLYGDQNEAYQYTPLVLATTHQMLNFRAAFDLMIIDEVDSFPYAGNQMLEYGVEKARKQLSTLIYLTATPTKKLRKKSNAGLIATSYLPLRFHQNLLPEIVTKTINDWRKKLPTKCLKQLQTFYKNQQRFLIFVPKVADTKTLCKVIKSHIPEMKGDFVSASDDLRQEKVESMRQENIQYLVTTTILERGVTFPGIDVIIFGAEEDTFTENALVQIAGRVGRSKERPTGLVQAYVQHINFKILAAQRQIKSMNKKGRMLKNQL